MDIKLYEWPAMQVVKDYHLCVSGKFQSMSLLSVGHLLNSRPLESSPNHHIEKLDFQAGLKC